MYPETGKEIVEIKRICGHTDKVSIRSDYKLERNRQKRIAVLESMLCFRCYFKKIKAEYGADLVPLRIDYSEFREMYKNCLVDYRSYNDNTHRITVYVRKQHKPRKKMITYLVKECEITVEQAKFLVDMDSHTKYFLSEWFDITDPGPKIKNAMTLIEENNPSYRYYETHARREGLFHLNDPAGEDILGGYDELFPVALPHNPLDQFDEFGDAFFEGDDLPF